MAERGILQAGALDGLADLLDVLEDDLGAGTSKLTGLDADGGVAVEILGTDRDTGDEAIELVAVLVDGLLKSSNLIVESLLAGGSPETEEDAGLGLDGGGNGGDGLVVGVTLL